MKIENWIKIWLITGLFMLFVQVIVGGITRLTGSGLSITKWEVVKGTLPPLNSTQWEEAFNLYKESPQYQKINQGIDMAKFKFIYFWEYIHRLWARTMGLVFLIPFLIFYFKKKLSRHLMKRLGLVVFFAVLAAIFGWIMVASGLVHRPWVNAYKLTIHLSIAFAVFATLLWATFEYYDPVTEKGRMPKLFKLTKWFTGILVFQIFIGGIVSGMKAGLFYPTWPDMLGYYFPQIMLNEEEWTVYNLVNYDTNPFAPAIIQFVHRNTAYILSILGVFVFFKIRSVKILSKNLNIGSYLFICMLITQVLLGIYTVINCSGKIPVTLGVFHQGFALLLLSSALYLNYLLKKNKFTD